MQLLRQAASRTSDRSLLGIRILELLQDSRHLMLKSGFLPPSPSTRPVPARRSCSPDDSLLFRSGVPFSADMQRLLSTLNNNALFGMECV